MHFFLKSFRPLAALVLAIFFLPNGPARSFGGEDLISGDPFHHEHMTCRAAAGDSGCGTGTLYPGAGFSPEAAHAITWHADYIDSYLYSPIWWAAPIRPLKILDRYKASRSNYWHLASLHFDDLNSTESIELTWQRYMSGTLLGLEWAAETDNIDAAHHLLGVSLHAVQDFYSHSTWINVEARRKYTYLQLPTQNRQRFALSTGAFEHEHAPVQHGKYNFACSAYNNTALGLNTVFEAICRGPEPLIPLRNLDFCEKARECQGSRAEMTTIEIESLDFLPGEFNVAVLTPPGIAMDTTWLSRIAAEQRGLTGPGGQGPPLSIADGEQLGFNPGLRARLGHVGVCKHIHLDIRNRMMRETLREIDLSDLATSAVVPMRPDLNFDPRAKCEEIIGNDRSCERESDYLFAEAKHLATVASHQWLELVESHFAARHPEFWHKVKTCRSQRGGGSLCRGEFSYRNPPDEITQSFEDYSKFPFQFITAGNDTPAAPAQSEGWYLRVQLDTADVRGAGTDADIYLQANGESFLLDYLNARDPASQIRSSLLVYNDLEAGDKQVYTVGPFDTLPASITLFNDSSSAAENWAALRRAIRVRMRRAWDSFVEFWRNDQDYVGPIDLVFERSDLDDIIEHGYASDGVDREPGKAIIRVDGGPEGIYDLTFSISQTDWRGREAQLAWREYQITLDEIFCVDESDIDGATRSDEPFFFLAISAYGLSMPQTANFGPYSNIGVDTDWPQRNVRTMYPRHSFAPIRLPPRGAIGLSGQVYEHDSETNAVRDRLYEEFRTSVDPRDIDDYNIFLSEWGRTLGGDWKLAHMKIHAFKRGPQPEFGLVHDETHNTWINEEATRTFTLNRAGVRSLDVDLDGMVALTPRFTGTLQPWVPRPNIKRPRTLKDKIRPTIDPTRLNLPRDDG